MPITIQNSAGGGVTLDSTTSSNETLQLPSGGGTLAPLASPVFTGNVGIGTSSPNYMLDVNGLASVTALYKHSAHNASFTIANRAAQPLVFGTDDTERMRIDSSGRVSIGGPPSAAWRTTIKQTESDYGVLSLERSSNVDSAFRSHVELTRAGVTVGRILTSQSATQYNTSSDYRLKENVVPMSGATAQTKLLKPCNFDWILGGNTNGFIAHEVAEVVPEAVSGTKDAMKDEEYEVTPAVLDDEGNETTAAVMATRSVPDMQGIDQSKLVPLLTATIQELIARIEELENV